MEQNKFEFGYWFEKEAKDLKRFFNIISAAIPAGILLTVINKTLNIQGLLDGNFHPESIDLNGVLLLSIILQFFFILFLVWRFVNRISRSNTIDKWRRSPDSLRNRPETINRFLHALNFRMDTPLQNADGDKEDKLQLLENHIKDAAINEVRFKYAWLTVWIVWLIQYVVKALLVYGKGRPNVDVVFLNNMYGLLVCIHIIVFAVCYFLLVSNDNKNSNGTRKASGAWWLYIIVLIVTVLFISISAFAEFTNFDETLNMVAVFLLKILRNTLLSTFFALMISKLLSNDLGSPPWLRITLFLYIAIIPLFVVFSDLPELKDTLMKNKGTENIAIVMNDLEVIIYNIALLFKFCLFLFVAWLIEKDHLLFYFLRFSGSFHEVARDRFEVETILHPHETNKNTQAEEP